MGRQAHQPLNRRGPAIATRSFESIFPVIQLRETTRAFVPAPPQTTLILGHGMRRVSETVGLESLQGRTMFEERQWGSQQDVSKQPLPTWLGFGVTKPRVAPFCGFNRLDGAFYDGEVHLLALVFLASQRQPAFSVYSFMPKDGGLSAELGKASVHPSMDG